MASFSKTVLKNLKLHTKICFITTWNMWSAFHIFNACPHIDINALSVTWLMMSWHQTCNNICFMASVFSCTVVTYRTLIIKIYWMRFYAEVLRGGFTLITLTKTLIILGITKTVSNNCFIKHWTKQNGSHVFASSLTAGDIKPANLIWLPLVTVSIRKFSIVIGMIGSPRAYLPRNRRVVTWVPNYRYPT